MSLRVSKEYIISISIDTHVESPHFPIYLQIKDNYFKEQLENDLYLPVSYYEFQAEAQPLDNMIIYTNTKYNNLKITTQSQNFTPSFKTQMLH